MPDRAAFSRTALQFGEEALTKLAASRVAVFGIGGVGSYVVEALARSGIGALDLIDNDIVEISNLNRQLIALHSTIGKNKTSAAKERILDINPDCLVRTYDAFISRDYFSEDNAGSSEEPYPDFAHYDYVADCIDTVSGKLAIIEKAKAAGIPVISCMGAGNKLDPTAFRVADISETSVCPLARVMRQELKKRAVTGVKVVFSTEKAFKPPQEKPAGKPVPASNSFVPGTAGLILAGEIIKDIIGR
ncbi:MAG: tRNA threonylcarbamoyladenosine dehydratase [Treponema sp.]|nr:tRNA threonylcarbamoyladenosine dehydratase [Treponema sp.]